MRIVLCYPVDARHLARISDSAPDAEVVDAGQQRIAEELLTADIFCGHAKVPVSWQDVVRLGRLRWIQSSAAGLDHCLVPCVVKSDIVVTSASGVFAEQVAEHTLALLLGLLRSLPTFYEAQQRHEFIRQPTGDLQGKTVGIVGFGGNGRRLAEVLSGFRVRLLATDMFPVNQPPCIESLWPAEQLDDLLSESDVVILCVPLNETTHHMIDSAAIAKMKPGAILVNVSRGSVVDESALVDGLRSDHVSGAALDVTETEPLDIRSPLWKMPNVIITPHVGAQSASRVDDTTSLFCQNLHRFMSGQHLLNRVDKRLGFPVPGTGFVWTRT